MVESHELLGKVHVQRQDSNTGETVVVDEHHYIRISAFGEAPLFLRHGQVLDESGKLIEFPPQAFWTEVDKCTTEALRRVGFSRSLVNKMRKAVPPPPVPVDTGEEPVEETTTEEQPEESGQNLTGTDVAVDEPLPPPPPPARPKRSWQKSRTK